MPIHSDYRGHTETDEALRRGLNRAVNRLFLETVQLEDDVHAALTEMLGRSLPADWLEHRSEAEVQRTHAVRVPDQSSAGAFELHGRRVLAFCVSELTMDSLRAALRALAHVDGHRAPDPIVLTWLVRHLLGVRRLDAELAAGRPISRR